MKNEGLIFKIKSKYILNEIFSFLNYVTPLKLIQYNKEIQKIINITFNDYSIDCEFKKVIKEIEDKNSEYMINKTIKGEPSFLFISSIILKIIFLILIAINFKFFKKNFYNIFLIFFLLYGFISLYYLLMNRYNNALSECYFSCYTIFEPIFYSITLVFIILKFYTDKKDNTVFLKILNCLMIGICAAIILLLIFTRLFFLKMPINKKGITRKIVKVDSCISIINKFRGFKVNQFKYLDPSTFGQFTSNDINSLINNLEYSLNNKQIELIELINGLRQNRNLNKLKYNQNEKLKDFYSQIKRFFIINNLNIINNKIYLFIYPMNEFRNKILKRNDIVMKIIFNSFLDNIIILEKNGNEYILIYELHNNINNNINNKINNKINNNINNDILNINNRAYYSTDRININLKD